MEALYNHLVNSHTDAPVVVALAAELDVPMLVLQHYGNIGSEYSLQEDPRLHIRRRDGGQQDGRLQGTN